MVFLGLIDKHAIDKLIKNATSDTFTHFLDKCHQFKLTDMWPEEKTDLLFSFIKHIPNEELVKLNKHKSELICDFILKHADLKHIKHYKDEILKICFTLNLHNLNINKIKLAASVFSHNQTPELEKIKKDMLLGKSSFSNGIIFMALLEEDKEFAQKLKETSFSTETINKLIAGYNFRILLNSKLPDEIVITQENEYCLVDNCFIDYMKEIGSKVKLNITKTDDVFLLRGLLPELLSLDVWDNFVISHKQKCKIIEHISDTQPEKIKELMKKLKPESSNHTRKTI